MTTKLSLTAHAPDPDGFVRVDAAYLTSPVYSRDRLSPDGKKVTMPARERAIREAKARILEAEAKWIRSGGSGTRDIESFFEVTDATDVG